jgi:peroxiredoxin
MQSRLRANLELGIQIVIAIAIVVVAGMLVKRQLFPSSTATRAPQINAGEKLPLANVDWEKNNKTLVFFLQKGCHFCAASAPFYRQLIADANDKKVSLIAVLPNPADDARQYLQSLDLPIENIQTGPLNNYKINGTPSVVFVDRQGTVRNVWFGANPQREQEMRETLDNLFASND